MSYHIRYLFIVILACLLSSTLAVGVLKKLTKSDTARCLDGSPAGYYEEISSSTPHRAIIFLQGGAWCHDDKTCYERSKTDLGSSENWPQTINSSRSGILSSDCSVNPHFCGFSKFFIKYCDGASFTGSRSYEASGKRLYSHGDYIIHEAVSAILDTISRSTPATARPEIMLVGCSAGGLASMVNTHRVHRHVQRVLPRAVFGTVPLSGFFQDVPTVEGERVYPQYIRQVFAHASPNLDGHPCTQVYSRDEQWKCLFTQHLLPLTSTSVFLVNSVVDSWQTRCVLTSKYTLQCAAASGWKACANAIEECSREQIKILSQYAHEMIATSNLNATTTSMVESAISAVLAPPRYTSDQELSSFYSYVDPLSGRVIIQKRDSIQITMPSTQFPQQYRDSDLPAMTYTPLSLPPFSGAFFHTCQTHCEGSSAIAYKIKVNDVPLLTAVHQWWKDLVHRSSSSEGLPSEGPSSAAQLGTPEHIHLPCSLHDHTPYQCNPTC